MSPTLLKFGTTLKLLSKVSAKFGIVRSQDLYAECSEGPVSALGVE
jgi:hypothetical protein